MSDWDSVFIAELCLQVRVRMDTPLWMEFEAYDRVSDDPEDTIEGDPPISGYIKWDGCAETYSLHVCGREQAVRVGALFARLYDMAAERMPEHKEYLK